VGSPAGGSGSASGKEEAFATDQPNAFTVVNEILKSIVAHTILSEVSRSAGCPRNTMGRSLRSGVTEKRAHLRFLLGTARLYTLCSRSAGCTFSSLSRAQRSFGRADVGELGVKPCSPGSPATTSGTRLLSEVCCGEFGTRPRDQPMGECSS